MDSRSAPRLSEIACVFAAALSLIAFLRRDALLLPFYWDEAGLYAPYAHSFYVSLFSPDISPFAESLSWYHTPLVAWTTGALTRLFGWKLEVMRWIGFASAAGLATATYALGRVWLDRSTASAVALALLFAPVVLSQAGLLQPDLPMAMLLTASMTTLLRGRALTAGLLFALGVLVKGTAVLLLPAWIWLEWRARRSPRDWFQVAWPTLLAFATWAIAYRVLTDQARIISTADAGVVMQNLGLVTFKRLWIRVYQWGALDGRWILSVLLAAALIRMRGDRRALGRWLEPLAATAFAGLVPLAVVGFLHERYLLVCLPLLYVYAARALPIALPALSTRRTRAAWLVIAVATAVIGWTQWRGPPAHTSGWEYRAGYAEYVRLTQTLTREIEASPGAGSGDFSVISRWPVSHALTRPELFYVRRPVATWDAATADFSLSLATDARQVVLVDDTSGRLPPRLEALQARLSQCRVFTQGPFTGRICELLKAS